MDGLQNFSAEADSSGSWTISLERKRAQGQPVCDPWVFWMARHLRSRKQPSAVPLAAFNHTPLTLNVTDAPNLTATIQGPLSNNSVLILEDNIWINGTATSISATPVGLAGNLQFSIRANGTSDSWTEVFNQSVNGAFSIQHFMPNDTLVAAGEIETRLRFYPSTLPATDDANVTLPDPYFLRGLLSFEVEKAAYVRGRKPWW